MLLLSVAAISDPHDATTISGMCFPESAEIWEMTQHNNNQLHADARRISIFVEEISTHVSRQQRMFNQYELVYFEVRITGQFDQNDHSIPTEEWPGDTLVIQGVSDVSPPLSSDWLVESVMLNAVVFRSEFDGLHICGWRPNLEVGAEYDYTITAPYDPYSFRNG